MFTNCDDDDGWWKLGDPLITDDDETKYNDPNYRYIMFDGDYFEHGYGPAADRKVNWVFDHVDEVANGGGEHRESSIVLGLNIGEAGLTLLDSRVVDAPPAIYFPGEYGFTARIVSRSGDILAEQGFPDPRIIQVELGNKGPAQIDSTDFVLVLPYFGLIDRAEIIDTRTGVELLSVDLSFYASLENVPPVANAGPDVRIECLSPDGSSVQLDAAGSSDPDGDELTYKWAGPFGAAYGVNPTVVIPLVPIPSRSLQMMEMAEAPSTRWS